MTFTFIIIAAKTAFNVATAKSVCYCYHCGSNTGTLVSVTLSRTQTHCLWQLDVTEVVIFVVDYAVGM